MSMNFLPCTLASIFSHSVIHLDASVSRDINGSKGDIHGWFILAELDKSQFIQVQLDVAARIMGRVGKHQLIPLGGDRRGEERQSQECCFDEHAADDVCSRGIWVYRLQ